MSEKHLHYCCDLYGSDLSFPLRHLFPPGTVLMKDRCKLFCRVAGTTAYYQLKDRVIDGTPCGPDTFDICVQGLCRVSEQGGKTSLPLKI